MTELRTEIDALDQRLVDLLAARAGYIDRAIELKSQTGWPARIPSRVDQVLGNVRAHAQDRGLDPDLAGALWTKLIDWSIEREEKVLGQTPAQIGEKT